MKEEIEKCKSALRDHSPGSVDLRQSMINIQNAKFGNSANELVSVTNPAKTFGASPPPILPKPSINERKKIIDNMRRENQKRFTSLKSVMSTKTDGEKGDLSSETGPTLSVQQTIESLIKDNQKLKEVNMQTTLGDYLQIQKSLLQHDQTLGTINTQRILAQSGENAVSPISK